ncbi:hypothetical protein FACS1894167_12200 [Synergistales bacterium]|nr:hypothetical protein FACS1894167_12200 [Synergistales bacterium]
MIDEGRTEINDAELDALLTAWPEEKAAEAAAAGKIFKFLFDVGMPESETEKIIDLLDGLTDIVRRGSFMKGILLGDLMAKESFTSLIEICQASSDNLWTCPCLDAVQSDAIEKSMNEVAAKTFTQEACEVVPFEEVKRYYIDRAGGRLDG